MALLPPALLRWQLQHLLHFHHVSGYLDTNTYHIFKSDSQDLPIQHLKKLVSVKVGHISHVYFNNSKGSLFSQKMVNAISYYSIWFVTYKIKYINLYCFYSVINWEQNRLVDYCLRGLVNLLETINIVAQECARPLSARMQLLQHLGMQMMRWWMVLSVWTCDNLPLSVKRTGPLFWFSLVNANQSAQGAGRGHKRSAGGHF